MSIHTQRLGAEFKKVLSEVIRDCVKDPRLSGLCSVTNVEITKDLKHAKVFISVYDDAAGKEDSIAVLNAASGVIAHEMNCRIKMRRIPQLHFVLDDSIEYSVHISKVIDDINKGRRDEDE